MKNLGAVEMECPYCGKKIIGVSEKQAQHLFKIHVFSRHKQLIEPSGEERKLVDFISSLPMEIVSALRDEKKQRLILDVLEGRVKTFKYLSKKPSWEEILKKAKKFGMGKSELITYCLNYWYEEMK
jgi:preprotein translocase subunit Sss1